MGTVIHIPKVSFGKYIGKIRDTISTMRNKQNEVTEFKDRSNQDIITATNKDLPVTSLSKKVIIKNAWVFGPDVNDKTESGGNSISTKVQSNANVGERGNIIDLRNSRNSDISKQSSIIDSPRMHRRNSAPGFVLSTISEDSIELSNHEFIRRSSESDIHSVKAQRAANTYSKIGNSGDIALQNMGEAHRNMSVAKNTEISASDRREAFEASLLHAQKAYILGSKDAVSFLSKHMAEGLSTNNDSRIYLVSPDKIQATRFLNIQKQASTLAKIDTATFEKVVKSQSKALHEAAFFHISGLVNNGKTMSETNAQRWEVRYIEIKTIGSLTNELWDMFERANKQTEM